AHAASLEDGHHGRAVHGEYGARERLVIAARHEYDVRMFDHWTIRGKLTDAGTATGQLDLIEPLDRVGRIQVLVEGRRGRDSDRGDSPRPNALGNVGREPRTRGHDHQRSASARMSTGDEIRQLVHASTIFAVHPGLVSQKRENLVAGRTLAVDQ